LMKSLLKEETIGYFDKRISDNFQVRHKKG